MTFFRIARLLALAAAFAAAAGCAAPQVGLLPAPPMTIRKEAPPSPARIPSAAPPAAAPQGAALQPPATRAGAASAAAAAPGAAPLPVADNTIPAPPPIPVGWKEYTDAIARTREAIARQKPGEAVAAWKSIEDGPYRADAIFHQGVLLHLAGDIDGAAAQYRRGTDDPPIHEPSAANLLGIYLMKGEIAKARALVTRSVPSGALAPTIPELVNNAGAVLLEAGETERAGSLLATLSSRNDNSAAAEWNRAVLAWRKGNAVAARTISGQLPAETGQLWVVTASRAAWDNGLASRIAGPYSSAPGGDRRLTPLARNFAAYTAYRAGKSDVADNILSEAARAPDAPPELLANLGLLQVERGQWKDGRSTLEQVTREHPSVPEGWLNLGIFREVYVGDAPGAVECYRRYVSLGGQRKDEVSKWIDWLQKPALPSSP